MAITSSKILIKLLNDFFVDADNSRAAHFETPKIAGFPSSMRILSEFFGLRTNFRITSSILEFTSFEYFQIFCIVFFPRPRGGTSKLKMIKRKYELHLAHLSGLDLKHNNKKNVKVNTIAWM